MSAALLPPAKESGWQTTALAFAAFALISIALTWPVILEPGHTLFGDFGDRRGQAWALWSDVSGLRGGGATQLLAAPHGTPVSQVVRQPFHEWPLLVLAHLADEIVAINVFTIVAFAATATLMFAFLRRLTGDSPSSFFGALAFGFCPAAVFQTMGGHGEYAWGLFVPLFALALFRNREARTWVSALFVGCAFAGVALVSIYMAYFCVFFALAFAVFDYSLAGRHEVARVTGNYLACAAFAAAAFAPFHPHAVAGLLAAGGDVERAFFARGFGELFVFSARPIDYLIPSMDHPVMGAWAEAPTRQRLRDNAFEQTLYLGVVPLSLIVCGLIASLGTAWEKRTKAVFLFFVAAGAWMWMVSLPPRIGSLPGVSYFAYPWVPMFRVYARAGILVAFCVACAGALALAHFSRLLGGRRSHGLVAAASALLAFEFWSVPPGHALPVAPPEVYRWLANEPGDLIVAEYPMVSFDESSFYSYPFWQRVHGKRLVNGAFPANAEAWDFFTKVRDLGDPATPGLLKAAGVDYVIVHKRGYAEGPIPYALKRYYSPARAAQKFGDGTPPPIPRGLELHRVFGDDLVFIPR